MLVHPWDEATTDQRRKVLAATDFGQLVTAGLVDGYPVVVPTHFLHDGDATVLLHLARPNPLWAALEQDPHVVLALALGETYVEAAWNAAPGSDPALGVPTSYYTAVQLRCVAEVVDDPDEKAAILAAQLAHHEPPGSTRRTPSAAEEADRRLLPGIRGLRLHVQQVVAKQKYGGNKQPTHRAAIAERLLERGAPHDARAAGQLRAQDPPHVT